MVGRNPEPEREFACGQLSGGLLFRRNRDRRPAARRDDQRAFPRLDGNRDFGEGDRGRWRRRDNQNRRNRQPLGDKDSAYKERQDAGEERTARDAPPLGQERRGQWRTTFGISM
jgi:hypothetical protein